jgi:hypothetical protein
VARIANTDLAFALQDEEHLLVDAMAVERKRAFAGRHHSQVVSEVLGADLPADLRDAAPKAFRRLRNSALRRHLGARHRFEIGDVDDRMHRMSSVQAAMDLRVLGERRALDAGRRSGIDVHFGSSASMLRRGAARIASVLSTRWKRATSGA